MKLPEELQEHSEAIDALRTIARVRWAVMEAIAREVRRQEGIPYEWVEVLILLADTPDDVLRMGDLASLTLRSKSGMTRLADRMERAGLIRRQANASDRRSVFIALTAQGQDLMERVKPSAVRLMIDRFTSHISPLEAHSITVTLTRILEANGVELEHGFPRDAKSMGPAMPARVLEKAQAR